MDREQLVRERAYLIWEAEGCPADCEQEHWERAVREIADEEAASSAGDDTGAGETDQATPATEKLGETATTSPVPEKAKRQRAAKGAAKPATPRAPRSKPAKSPA